MEKNNRLSNVHRRLAVFMESKTRKMNERMDIYKYCSAISSMNGALTLID